MNEKDLQELNAVLAAHQAHVAEQLEEFAARLSAMRLLLEDAFADAYIGRLEEFTARMDGLLRVTRSAATRAMPMTEDQAIEMQARIATHLQRFQQSTEPRIRARTEHRGG